MSRNGGIGEKENICRVIYSHRRDCDNFRSGSRRSGG